jgi:hypothetical protein
MPHTMQETRELHFAEEVGLLWETHGAPRMAGRILGWLLICDPPEQTATQIADALHASKGSVSTNTRLLLHHMMIEKVPRTRDRGTLLRISEGAWTQTLRAKVDHLTLFRELAERGLDLVKDFEPARGSRLRELHDIYDFLEREYPLLLDRWEAERAARTTEEP